MSRSIESVRLLVAVTGAVFVQLAANTSACGGDDVLYRLYLQERYEQILEKRGYHPEKTKSLCQSLRDAEGMVRLSAIRVVAKQAAVSCKPTLIEQLSQEPEVARYSADVMMLAGAEALAELDDREAARRFARRVLSEYPSQASAARAAGVLARLGSADGYSLLLRLMGANKIVRAAEAKILLDFLRFPNLDPLGELAKLAADDDVAVRLGAVSAIATLESTRSVSILKDRLRVERSQSVRDLIQRRLEEHR